MTQTTKNTDMTEISDNKASPCGLFIRLSEEVTGPDLLRKVREMFFVINHGPSRYKKNSHILAIPRKMTSTLSADHLKGYVEIAKSQGIVCLMEEDVQACSDHGADGVILNDLDSVSDCRNRLGDTAIIGLRCGNDIDLAERAIEKGADFVTFHTSNGSMIDPKVAAVWSTLSDKPCLLEGPFTNDYVAAYVTAGADFIEAGSYIWDHKEGVKQGTVNMIHAVELALQAPGKIN